LTRLSLYAAELRAPFFTASIVPISLGAAVAWAGGAGFSWSLFILTLAGGLLLHGGTNVANDYFDHLNRNDEVNRDFFHPLTGGSRLIQRGLLAPREVIIESLVLFCLAALIGIYLVKERGLVILWLGLFGALSGFFYSAPPLALVNRGLGEILIGLNFGILMTIGSYYVQAGRIAWEPALAAVPVAIMIVLVVYINQFPDRKADLAVGKNHWVARLGYKRSALGYVTLAGLAYLFLAAVALLGLVTPTAALGLLSLPVAVYCAGIVLRHHSTLERLRPANSATIALHLITGVLLVTGYLIAGIH